jgi:MoxR-like ATPase
MLSIAFCVFRNPMTLHDPFVPSLPSPAAEPVHGQSTPKARLNAAIDQVNAVVLGKPEQIKLAFACLLAAGHLLLEDLPGTGKTLLARSMGAVLGLDFQRIQFTSDLMPSDILGVSIYRPDSRQFELHRGPIFTHILLADEINRASPRTQSALLEAMAENQVSIDRQTLALPQPFLVMATQNPLDMNGTFPLPSAQLDRFLFQVSLGYPDRASELDLMRGIPRTELLDAQCHDHALSVSDLMSLRGQVRKVTVTDPLLDYCYSLVEATRNNEAFQVGLSPRASLALVSAARALAFLAERNYATPEDVQEAFLPLAVHRVQAAGAIQSNIRSLLTDILRQTQVP